MMNKLNSPSQGKAGKVILMWIGRVSPLFKSTDIFKHQIAKYFQKIQSFVSWKSKSLLTINDKPSQTSPETK